MTGFTRSARGVYERSDDWLGRSWPFWSLAILFYAAVAHVLLTRVNLPSPAHLVVYTMAAATLIVTILNVEWALVGLAAMIPFARPGFTLGTSFHVSGFNMAVAGVWVVFMVRYMTDKRVAAKGPLFRRTAVDIPNAAFVLLLTISSLAGLDLNAGREAHERLLLYYKEQIFYLAWFYLAVALMRRPEDVRRFAMFFAMSGLLVAAVGLYARLSGTVSEVRSLTEAETEAGVAGARAGGVGGGGWFGLGHPNLFAAFLVMAMPTWFYAVDHLKSAGAKLVDNLAILLGFIALLYTYSRSGWIGIVTGLAMLGITRPRTLARAVLFLGLFAVVAQVLTVALVDMGVIEVVRMRFEQLQRSNLSSRPEIYRAAWQIIRAHPLLGVGVGEFSLHAKGARMAWIAHAHNILLTYAAEMGLPCMILFIVVIGKVVRMGIRNLHRGNVPGYGFLAEGTYVGLFAILTLSMFDHIFFDRNVGHAFYALLAIIVSYDRMFRDGLLPPPQVERESNGARRRAGRLWVGT